MHPMAFAAGTLSRVASSPIAVARAALVEVVAVPGKDGSSCTAKLRAVCTTLDEAVAQAGVLSGPGSGARDAEHVGLADTAALAHALLAAALVQQQPTVSAGSTPTQIGADARRTMMTACAAGMSSVTSIN